MPQRRAVASPPRAAPPRRVHRPVRARFGRGLLPLLGPAFVAAIAYVDPGNVAANITAGARYGYLLVWVLVVANAMAVLIQYQSARLGLVTGRSLPELLGERLRKRSRLAFWVQAEVVAAATDVAEVIGGAIALQLLFGLPLVVGGVVVGLISMVLLSVQGRGQRRFEAAVIALLLVIAVGFLLALIIHVPSPRGVLGGLVPRLEGSDSLVVAASMLGATVMPHAIYLHSALARDRHGRPEQGAALQRVIRATRWDVVAALVVAGAVNIGLLLVAATNLQGVPGTDTIEGAYHAIGSVFGPAVAAVFAVGLLASGLASTSVGSYAGAVVMTGLLHVRVPLLARRVVTLIPALVILALGADPTWALVLSQVVLSFGIAFAVVPLARYSGRRDLMGVHADGPVMKLASWVTVVLIVGLNLALLLLSI